MHHTTKSPLSQKVPYVIHNYNNTYKNGTLNKDNPTSWRPSNSYNDHLNDSDENNIDNNYQSDGQSSCYCHSARGSTEILPSSLSLSLTLFSLSLSSLSYSILTLQNVRCWYFMKERERESVELTSCLWCATSVGVQHFHFEEAVYLQRLHLHLPWRLHIPPPLTIMSWVGLKRLRTRWCSEDNLPYV